MPIYIMLNKPSGCVTACRDDTHSTVMDCLDGLPKEVVGTLHPVGRLDIDTKGFCCSLTTENSITAFFSRDIMSKSGIFSARSGILPMKTQGALKTVSSSIIKTTTRCRRSMSPLENALFAMFFPYCLRSGARNG